MESRARLHLLGIRAGAAAAVLLLAAATAPARVLLAQKEALKLAFPDSAFERRTAYLTDEQTAAAEAAARAKLESRLWTYYVGTSTQGAGTAAYFESHPVRTMNEAFMVVVGPGAKVKFVEILAFAEPDDYRAPRRWLRQFEGRRLDGELALRRGLRNIAGATLTAEAVARGVRRVLAVHRALHADANDTLGP